MRKLAFLILALVCASGYAAAQKTPALTFGAALNVQDSGTCSTPGSFIWQTSLPQNANTTTVNVAGTFSATLTVRMSNNGGASWSTAGTISSAGTTSYSTNGFTDFCVDVTAYSSGIANVSISTGISNGNGGGSGGAGVPITTVGGLSAYNSQPAGFLASVTNGANATDCSTGGGTNKVLCQYQGGGSWSAVAQSGVSGVSSFNGSSGAVVFPSPLANGLVDCTGTNCSTQTTVAAPSGTIVGTTDTQTMTNKTVDGVAPATFAFLDATSSIQTQLNSKAPLTSPTFTGTVTMPTMSLGGNVSAPSAITFNFSNITLSNFPTLNQNTSGTAANLSGTPALPNGTTATTQTTGDNTTKIATDAFVIANAGGGGSLPSGVAGQTPVNTGASATTYSAQSPTLPLGNGGALVSLASANYSIFCDSATVATGIQDRGKVIKVGTGGSFDVIVPDFSGSGCSLMYGQIENAASTTITVSRQTTDTFNVFGPSQGAPTTGATTFTLAVGQWATYSPSESLTAYDIRIYAPTASGTGTVTDGSGVSTANEVAVSTISAHAITYAGTLPTAAMPALTGDVTTPGSSLATTLASVGSAGSCGDASHSCGLTFDAKGRETARANNTISIPLSQVTSRYWSCQSGLGDGLNAIPAGTYLQTYCYNDTGSTVTLSGLKCYIDGGSSSTMNATNGGGTGLLTGAVTCSTSFAAGTQSGTTTIASGDYIKFTFVADGTAKQTTFVVTGSY